MISFLKKIPFVLIMVFFISAGTVWSGEVIQTQESDSWEGVEVDLLSLKIKNNIVTVKFKLRNTGSEEQRPKIFYDSCFIMDETNQKKYYALKDSDGFFIAGPVSDENRGGRFWFGIQPGKSKGMWIKFPEPADNPETITISIPGVFPFEEIELKK